MNIDMSIKFDCASNHVLIMYTTYKLIEYHRLAHLPTPCHKKCIPPNTYRNFLSTPHACSHVTIYECGRNHLELIKTDSM